MAEKQITVDGNTYELDDLFFVIATANPVEQAGTFPLPEAQLDRFMVKLSLGYPSDSLEKKIFRSQNISHPIKNLECVIEPEEIIEIKKAIPYIQVHDPILDYAYAIIKRTRNHPDILLGASPRATISFVKMSQSLALAEGSKFVTPDHIQKLVVPVLSHRIVLTPEARYSQKNSTKILSDIVSSVDVPIGL